MKRSTMTDQSLPEQGEAPVITVAVKAGQVQEMAVADDVRVNDVRTDEMESAREETEEDTPKTEATSGVGEYRDGAGELLGGVDRLGSLGTSHWERGKMVENEDAGLGAARMPGDPLVPASPLPGPTAPDQGGLYPYSARAVLHAQDATGNDLSAYYVNASAIFDTTLIRVWQPAGSAPVVEYLGGDGENLVKMTTSSDGGITFTLNTAAVEWFAANTDEKYIELYYDVTVSGQTYTMQVVIPIHGEFCSEDFSAACRYSDTDNCSLVHGEWHAGRCIEDSGSVYTVSSTNMNDEMTYDGRVENAIIHTGYAKNGEWGADSVTLNCHVAASNGKETEIIAKGANSSIMVNGNRADKGVVLAESGGTTVLEASGANSSVSVVNVADAGHGAVAGKNSSIVVDASGAGNAIIFDTKGQSVSAQGGAISLDASGEDGYISITGQTALLADDDGSIKLKAADTITILASQSGVVGSNGGSNTLTASAIDITVKSDSGALDGVQAYGGENTLTAEDITITVAGVSGGMGIMADVNGKNSIEAENGIVLDIDASHGAAYGIATKDHYSAYVKTAENDITAQYIDISVNSSASAIGINAGRHGDNVITLTGSDENGRALSIQANDDTLFGLGLANNQAPAQGTAGLSSTVGNNTINNVGGGDIAIAVGYVEDENGDLQRGANQDISHGVFASSGETVINAGGGQVDIQVAGGRFASGMTGSYQGGLAVLSNASALNIDVDSVYNGGTVFYHFASGAYGLSTAYLGSVKVEEVEEVNINVQCYRDAPETSLARYVAAFGGYEGEELLVNAETETKNTITATVAGDGRVVAGQYLATVLSGNTTSNRVQIGGENTTLIEYTITGTAEKNTATSQDPFEQSIAAGMYGDFHSMSGGPTAIHENVLMANKAVFTVTGENMTHAAGMWANISSNNVLYADELEMDIKTTGSTDAHGMAAEVTETSVGGAGFNTVTVDTAEITATAEGTGAAYGMKAYNHSQGWSSTPGGSGNEILSEEAIDLTITASAASSGEAYAMYAASPNGSSYSYNYNLITGNSSEDTSDSIILNGDLYTDSISKNTITTGSGQDYVRINGECHGSGNSISTNDGDDTIVLNGYIANGGLTIDAGEGTDTLILAASDVTEFESFYQTWLNSADLSAMNIETISLFGVAPGEVSWLQSLADTANITLQTQANLMLLEQGII
ncbi:MAG: hypothetical protein DELT_00752 [Desulfovibrio sp.]